MALKLNLIIAACENNGIGKNGTLPWRLKKEMGYFTRMTSSTEGVDKKNAVIMGRKTWDSIPTKYRPLTDRINIVLSRNLKCVDDKSVLVCESLDKAVSELSKNAKYSDILEKVWVIGGSQVYKESLQSPFCHRIYLTHIKKSFDCDTFFEGVPKNFQLVKDSDVPDEIQIENGIEYEFRVYEKMS